MRGIRRSSLIDGIYARILYLEMGRIQSPIIWSSISEFISQHIQFSQRFCRSISRLKLRGDNI